MQLGFRVRVKDYKELKVWRKSIDLVKNIYSILYEFPKEETYSLADQIKRSVISIPANIAEGSGRNTTKEFIQFLYIALGSTYELETHLLISTEICYLKNIEEIMFKLNEIKKMLNGLISSLKDKLKKDGVR